jgi:hypothetical protein
MVMLDPRMNGPSDGSADSMAMATAYRDASVSVCKRNECDLTKITLLSNAVLVRQVSPHLISCFSLSL